LIFRTGEKAARDAEFFNTLLSGERLETEEMRQQWAEDVKLMAHTQYASFPLTTPEERDTFLHGTIWNGETERRKFI